MRCQLCSPSVEVYLLLTFLLLACGLVQFNLGDANDFTGELFERNPPFVDLSLKSGILLSLVGQVNWATVVLQDLAFSIVCDVDVACSFAC